MLAARTAVPHFSVSSVMSLPKSVKIMGVSRHKLVNTLRGYVRAPEMFNDHPGSGYFESKRPTCTAMATGRGA